MDLYLVRSSIIQALKEFLPQCKGVFLDIGCGEMPYKPLIQQSGGITKYIGMDIENPKYQINVKPDIFWNGTHIPLADNYIDCAMATELFEHLPDINAVLKEIIRILKPGGTLFFTVPFIWPLHDMPQDEYRYTPFSIRRHLEHTGFQIDQLQALGGWDASLAQMIGLWVKRRPMSDENRREFMTNLFPFYQELIKFEAQHKPPAYEDMSRESSMITGLKGIVQKPAREPDAPNKVSTPRKAHNKSHRR